jgi:hypothetical protein
MITLKKATSISIVGERVTFDRYPTGWVATGWEQGLPVYRSPVDVSRIEQILQRFDSALVSIR